MPTMVWNAKRTTFTGGRSSAGTESRPCTSAFGSWSASSESSLGILIPYSTPSPSYQPSRCTGAPLSVFASPSRAASLTGCACGDLAPGPVADDDLDGRGERGERERDDQRDAVVARRARRAGAIHAYTPAVTKPATM